MLSVNSVSVLFSGETLFSSVSFKINKGDRIGLAGKNGAGKTTMLKVLSGELQVDEGSVSKDGDIRIGILKQDIDFEDKFTLMGEIEHSFVEIKSIEKKIEEINNQLQIRTDYQSDSYMKLIEQLHELTHRFELIGGYTFTGNIEKVLFGLGFSREDFDKNTSLFSGGWRMRIELAKLLLQNNDILLLDEPTNHLDIESILWLEDFLNKFQGGVILVSHDKTFLDNVTNRTIEISCGKIYDFKHSYSKYLELRSEIREKQIATRKNQEKEIEHTEKLIEKFRYKASKASFAQNLIRKLEKTELIEVDTDDIAAMNLKFQSDSPSGKVVFRAEEVSKSFDDKKVLNGVDIIVERGDKIALVGKNGQGKTTFVRCVLDEISYNGKIEIGHNVKIGYFAQNQKENLDGEKTLIQTIEDSASEVMRPRSRDLLGAFLFSGDAVDKKVKVLSGGERGRLALCKLLVKPFNVLVMDEPTNHLDIRSKKILKEALLAFEGTIVLVSHDRDFLEGLANKVYEFREGRAKEYLGDINFYLEQRKVDSLREMEKEVMLEDAVVSTKKQSPSKENKQVKNTDKASFKKQNLEKEIEEIEKQIAEKEALFASCEFSADSKIFKQYQDLKKLLDEKLNEFFN